MFYRCLRYCAEKCAVACEKIARLCLIVEDWAWYKGRGKT